MDNCTQCNAIQDRINFVEPGEYVAHARLLLDLISQGNLELLHADFPLEEIARESWTYDVIHHGFRCTQCQRLFDLTADTYHGGAYWKSFPGVPAVPLL